MFVGAYGAMKLSRMICRRKGKTMLSETGAMVFVIAGMGMAVINCVLVFLGGFKSRELTRNVVLRGREYDLEEGSERIEEITSERIPWVGNVIRTREEDIVRVDLVGVETRSKTVFLWRRFDTDWELQKREYWIYVPKDFWLELEEVSDETAGF